MNGKIKETSDDYQRMIIGTFPKIAEKLKELFV